MEPDMSQPILFREDETVPVVDEVEEKEEVDI